MSAETFRIDCEICGERYAGTEEEVRRWTRETWTLDGNGREEAIAHCHSCEVNHQSSFVYALSSRSSDVYHLADGDGETRCGSRVDIHHREQSQDAPVGWTRCRRPGCAEVGE